jgi:hypothetical protein
MDVEYQKKEINWCLDRVGPQICLKATVINDQLRQLEMTSDEFKITFEHDEAREFLGIIRKLVSAKPESFPASDTESTPIEKPIEHPIASPIEDFIPVPEKEAIEPKPVTSLDTSEILEVLKQSESNAGEERISFRKKFAENEALEKEVAEQPDSRDEIDESVPGIVIEETVTPSEFFREKLDTASFFREVEEKSPLEQLLEESDNRTEDIASVDSPMPDMGPPDEPEDSTAESETTAPLSPDDLVSSSFMSKFDSRPLEQEIETKIEEPVENEIGTDLNHQDNIPAQKSGFLTEEDRKKEIERDRAARKKRLWELTRGF